MAGIGTLTATALLGALVYKGIDLVKYVIVLIQNLNPGGDTDIEATRDKALNDLLTLVLGAVVGFLAVWLFSLTSYAADVSIAGQKLSDLNFPSILALGLVITSVAGVLFDVKNAIDSTGSAATPKIIRPVERSRQAMVAKTTAKQQPAGADD